MQTMQLDNAAYNTGITLISSNFNYSQRVKKCFKC